MEIRKIKIRTIGKIQVSSPQERAGYTPSDEKLLSLIQPLIPEKGRDGETPSDEKLVSIIKKLIPPVKDGKTPTKQEIIDLIIPLIPAVKDGKTPTKDELEAIIIPLIPKVEVDDGEKIINKINKSKGKIDAERIRGLERYMTWGGSNESFNVEIPNGVKNGVNRRFKVNNIPKAIILDGLWYFNNGGYSLSGSYIIIDERLAPRSDSILRSVF